MSQFYKWRRQWRPTPVLLPGKIPWMEEPGRLQFMGLLNPTRLSDFTFTFHFHALEKEMATHSSVLAWRIPGAGSLVGCCLWGLAESDTREATQQQFYKCPTFYSMHSLLNSLLSSQFCTFLKQRKDIISLHCFHCSCHFCCLEF